MGRQPIALIKGTMSSGAVAVARRMPAPQIALARDRSCAGNQWLVIALSIGIWTPSPKPSNNRKPIKAERDWPSGALKIVKREKAAIAAITLRLGPNLSARGLNSMLERA